MLDGLPFQVFSLHAGSFKISKLLLTEWYYIIIAGDIEIDLTPMIQIAGLNGTLRYKGIGTTQYKWVKKGLKSNATLFLQFIRLNVPHVRRGCRRAGASGIATK